MNYYFIDYENVHADGFIGIENLGENDIICVMYTEQSKTFSLELVEKIVRQKARLESYKARDWCQKFTGFSVGVLSRLYDCKRGLH